MTCKGFVIAMRARIANVPFDRPFLCQGALDADWLIVSRWGGQAEYLTVSSADDRPESAAAGTTMTIAGGEAGPLGVATAGGPEAAPAGLHPRRTWFGVLAPGEGSRESVFLLNRSLPKDVPVAGRFAPAEGFVRLIVAEDGTLQLLAVAREIPEEPVPPPAPAVSIRPAALRRKAAGSDAAAARAQAWMLTAERRPWIGEFLDCSET